MVSIYICTGLYNSACLVVWFWQVSPPIEPISIQLVQRIHLTLVHIHRLGTMSKWYFIMFQSFSNTHNNFILFFNFVRLVVIGLYYTDRTASCHELNVMLGFDSILLPTDNNLVNVSKTYLRWGRKKVIESTVGTRAPMEKTPLFKRPCLSTYLSTGGLRREGEWRPRLADDS